MPWSYGTLSVNWVCVGSVSIGAEPKAIGHHQLMSTCADVPPNLAGRWLLPGFALCTENTVNDLKRCAEVFQLLRYEVDCKPASPQQGDSKTEQRHNGNADHD
jgi:hypothetical protein